MLRILAAGATLVLITTSFAADQPSLRFDNGLWFNGERFVPATVFVEYGQLRFAKDKKGARAPAEQVVDLTGKHVAPPFCEAHTTISASRIWRETRAPSTTTFATAFSMCR